MLTERMVDNVVRQVGVSRQTVIDIVQVLEADSADVTAVESSTETDLGESGGNPSAPSFLETDTAPVKDSANDNA